MKDTNGMAQNVSALVVTFLFLSLLPLSTRANNDSVTIRAPAVSQTSGGYVGAVLSITVSAVPGEGHIYVDTWPLTELDTQASARLAVEVAGRITGKDVSQYDFYYVIRSDSPVIGGPSAGGVMTVATIAVLEGLEIDPTIMMTGMINPDESIGPVGGIIEKLDASTELGIDTFLVPWGQTIITTQEIAPFSSRWGPQVTTKKVDVIEYAEETYGITVIEIKDIADAVFYFTGIQFDGEEVEGEVEVSTAFLSSNADDALERTEEYRDEILILLSSKDLDRYEKGYLDWYLETAQGLIDNATEDISDERYYTALISLLNAEMYIGVVDEYLSIESLDSRIDALEEKIEETDLALKEKRESIRGLVSLEFLSAAEKELKEANDYEEIAKNSERDILETVYAVIYADKKADTVNLWLDLAVQYSEGEKISLEELKEDAWKRIEEANLVYVYVESMMESTTLLEDAATSLSAAQSEYDAGRYTSSLFYAIESSISSSIAIELGLSSDDPEVITEKVERAREDAEIAIQLSREEGYEPMLAACYYEYGVSLEEEESAVSAFHMYTYAKEIALAYKHLGTGELMPAAESVSTTSETVATTPAPRESHGLGEGSQIIVVLGAGMIGLVIGILIGSMRKRREQENEVIG
jgi:uncharacterized protein